MAPKLAHATIRPSKQAPDATAEGPPAALLQSNSGKTFIAALEANKIKDLVLLINNQLFIRKASHNDPDLKLYSIVWQGAIFPRQLWAYVNGASLHTLRICCPRGSSASVRRPPRTRLMTDCLRQMPALEVLELAYIVPYIATPAPHNAVHFPNARTLTLRSRPDDVALLVRMLRVPLSTRMVLELDAETGEECYPLFSALVFHWAQDRTERPFEMLRFDNPVLTAEPPALCAYLYRKLPSSSDVLTTPPEVEISFLIAHSCGIVVLMQRLLRFLPQKMLTRFELDATLDTPWYPQVWPLLLGNIGGLQSVRAHGEGARALIAALMYWRYEVESEMEWHSLQWWLQHGARPGGTEGASARPREIFLQGLQTLTLVGVSGMTGLETLLALRAQVRPPLSISFSPQ
ncbi:hypothetical protein FA95DRAFT_1683776 [Auriscalpium vulgare]|uniref:Uncharacterized protein n=1 Tax=Auriscalpium vulgare TaxID=40419 RepID=A0ACB8R939_9AGAM|nr:hypothetical protein FA95DRAFT_1683776 [Auriscalpium vulgare]